MSEQQVEEKKPRKSTIDRVCNFFLWLASGSAVLMLGSGIYLAVDYFANKDTDIKKQIVITDLYQKNSLSVEGDAIFPGESKVYYVDVVSKLIENVRYSISFTNHTVKDYDHFFYISLEDSKGTPLINNTLDQIFNDKIAIDYLTLSSLESDQLKFTFSMSPLLTTQGLEFEFDILFEAKGKLVY